MARPKKIAALLAKARRDDKRLSDWMRANVDALHAELGQGRITWRAVMVVIRDLGLLDAHGQPPSRDTVARTWARVRRSVEADRQRRAAKLPVPLRPDELAPGVRRLDPPPAGSASGGRSARPPLDLRPARPRPEATSAIAPQPRHPAGAPANAATTRTGTPPEDATEQIGRILGEMGARRVRIPGRTS